MKNSKILLVAWVMILLPLTSSGQSKIPPFQKPCSPSTNVVYIGNSGNKTKKVFKNGDYFIVDSCSSHGLPRKITYYFHNGDRYSGEGGKVYFRSQSYINGRGIYYFLNGDRFEGFIDDNKWDGDGVYYYANGWRYVGTWDRGKVVSAGTLISPEKKEIVCMNGKIISSQKISFSDFSVVDNLLANNGKEEKIKKEDIPHPKESDVDVNIPATKKSMNNTFAFIIANEDYRHISCVPYASNDGKIMSEYCRKALGVPEKNIHFYENATLGDMRYVIKQINEISIAFGGEASFILYYAGHGVPSNDMTQSFLLPIDGHGADASALSLTELYKELGALKVRSIVCFLDACFSGSQRDGTMLITTRGVAIKAKPVTPQGQMVVFSAAQGDETAYPDKENNHGLFTYFLLKKLQESKGECTLGELSEYVTTNVKKRSVIVNGKIQTPTTSVSNNFINWRSIKLK